MTAIMFIAHVISLC